MSLLALARCRLSPTQNVQTETPCQIYKRPPLPLNPMAGRAAAAAAAAAGEEDDEGDTLAAAAAAAAATTAAAPLAVQLLLLLVVGWRRGLAPLLIAPLPLPH